MNENPLLKTLVHDQYRLEVHASGASQSSYQGLALNRWRDDEVEDAWGWFLYLRDLQSGDFTSLGLQPARRADTRHGFTSGDGWAALTLDWRDIHGRWHISLDELGEQRQLTLDNHSQQTRALELSSYLEVALFDPRGDAFHPAFAKLFVETELDPASGALLAQRRPRAQSETWPCLWQLLLDAPGELEWDSDRMSFLGRGRGPEHPLAMEQQRLGGRLGKVLDPIFGLRARVTLPPGANCRLSWRLGLAADRQQALAQVRALQPRPPVLASILPETDKHQSEPPCSLAHWNGTGGFDPKDDSYVLPLRWQPDTQSHRLPPLPWINVIANPLGGCLISERGAGYSWFRNSQANRLSPWANDPVSDRHGEALYLRDPDSGCFWSPLPGPAPATAHYLVRHSPGLSRFEVEAHGWASSVEISMVSDQPLRITRLRLRNTLDVARKIQCFSYLQLVLGMLPPQAGTIKTGQLELLGQQLLWARNPQAGPFADGIGFSLLFAPGQQKVSGSQSCDRLAFIGRHGRLDAPQALRQPGDLDGHSDSPGHPCFATEASWRVDPNAELEIFWLLGEVRDMDAIEPLVRPWLDLGHSQIDSRDMARQLVARLQVDIPEPSLMPLLNSWLPWQILGCRIWARSALYQSGGAFGYRDQLQDAAGLLPLAPEQTREAILRHAAAQFRAGDVCHWWHPEPLAHGLRSRCSDDLLWLPKLCADYLHASGDYALLDEQIAFLAGPELAPEQEDAYLPLIASEESASLYEHCCRALDRSLALGAHGLPLIGTGDWNDGMNRLGRKGRGESVWLAFFLYRILGDWLPICERFQDTGRLGRYDAHRQVLLKGLEGAGWDGGWYRRAYDDEGLALGSQENQECRIDALAQSWAVISGAAPLEKATAAMDALEEQLIDEEAGIIRLLTPPFISDPRDPGYIKGYVAGVRENGGQYSHAACWVVQATALLGRHQRAWELLRMLSPINHSRDPHQVARYMGEPYVLAADVYGAEPHLGRAGWSWYTGAAGWFYRIAIETLLGFSILEGTYLRLAPRIPDHWPGFGIRYALPGGGQLSIRLDNPERKARVIQSARLDGQPLAHQPDALRFGLPNDGQDHRLLVVVSAD